MSLLRISATELTNTDVDFVALVKRGANRLPFRITKGDDEMIDLNAIGRRFLKKADAAPSVVAIIARKEDAKSPSIAALAKAYGLDDEKLEKSEDDALLTLTKKDAPTTGVIVVKLDDNTGVSVANSKLKRGFDNFDFAGTAFEGLAGSQGFCVGPTVAAGLHKSAIDAIVADPDIATLQDRLTKANDAFAAYFGVLTAYAPAELMKAGTGNANGGAGMDQETGDGLGDQANKGKTTKADAGKNGTGAGVEMGQGTGTNDRATADDEANTEVNATDGEHVSGDDSGLDPKLKAPTKKEGEQVDDASTNSAQSVLAPKQNAPTKASGVNKDGDRTEEDMKKMKKNAEALLSMAKALGFVVETSGDGSSHKIEITSVEPQGESQAGEGAAQSPTESEAAAARASADDNANAGGNDVAGKVKGKTLDMNGVPEKLQAATTKNDGDADIGKKGTGADLPDAQSGAGAQKKDVRPPAAEDAIRRMIQALAKSVQDSNAAVTKTVEALAARVDGVAALAKKTDAALQGTVFNEDGDDRSAARAQKSVDGMGGIPLLDTGLSRRLV